MNYKSLISIALMSIISTSLTYAKQYSNPVIDRSLPDPTIMQTEDGTFYVYATENIRNVPIYRSQNLVDWEFVGTAFTDETRPDFEPKGRIWAPDINRIGNKYVLYYSMSVWGGEWTCGIGVASADSPEGPFTDHGMLFRSNGIGVQNSIDPFYINDNGKNYLFWGSFHGIYGIELSKDGLSLAKRAKPRQVAGSAYEGTYIYPRNGYYYMFASTGTCCDGLNSTYQTVVGRSKNIWGPYVSPEDKPMLENNHKVVIHKNEKFVGTGHNSEIITDDNGNEWILYHAFEVDSPQGRKLMLDRVVWINDWPYVATDSPSLEHDTPEFNK